MEARSGGPRRNSVTRLLLSEINANIHRHSNGSSESMEEIGYRPNRGEFISQGAENRQHGLEQSHPQYNYKYPSSGRGHQLAVERSLGAV